MAAWWFILVMYIVYICGNIYLRRPTTLWNSQIWSTIKVRAYSELSAYISCIRSIHIIHMYTYIHTSICSKKLAGLRMYVCMFVLSWCACSSVRFTVVLLACVVSVGEVVRDAPTPLLQHGRQNTKDVERYVSGTTATCTYVLGVSTSSPHLKTL